MRNERGTARDGSKGNAQRLRAGKGRRLDPQRRNRAAQKFVGRCCRSSRRGGRARHKRGVRLPEQPCADSDREQNGGDISDAGVNRSRRGGGGCEARGVFESFEVDGPRAPESGRRGEGGERGDGELRDVGDGGDFHAREVRGRRKGACRRAQPARACDYGGGGCDSLPFGQVRRPQRGAEKRARHVRPYGVGRGRAVAGAHRRDEARGRDFRGGL